MKNFKRLTAALLAVVMMAGTIGAPQQVKAAEAKGEYEALKESEHGDQPFDVMVEIYDKNTKDIEIQWITEIDSLTTGFDIELCEDANFANGKVLAYSVSLDQVAKSVNNDMRIINYSYHVPFTALGDGAEFYVRVKNTDMEEFSTEFGYSEQSYSAWKICDNNFKGMTKLLKSGVDWTNRKYDRNRDGWLSPYEIYYTVFISNFKIRTAKDGGHYFRNDKPKDIQCAVTDLKGIEKLKYLKFIYFNGTKMKSANITGVNLDVIGFYNVKTTSFKLKADSAKMVYVVADHDTKKKAEKLTKIDVSQCKSTRSFSLDCRNSGTVKLPNSKNIMGLDLRDVNMKTLDCNKYPKLLELNISGGKYKAIKADKCKSLLYASVRNTEGLKKLNFSKNKKLRALAYDNSGIKKSNIKAPKKCKLTNNKGIWWCGKDKYQKDVVDKFWE